MSASTKTPSSSTRPSLAIIGGGISGVLLSLSIAQHAPHLLPITLYEAASAFGEIGAGVAFGPNAVRAMNSISQEVRQGFERCATSNAAERKQGTWFDFWCGVADGNPERRKHGGGVELKVAEGEHICESRTTVEGEEMEGGGMVHRAAFLDEMVKLVPAGVHVKFKKRVVDYQQLPNGEGVVLSFADGTDARHDAAIGCDGIKSRTRVILLGADDPAAHAVFTGKYCYRGLIPMEQAAAAIGHDMARNSQMYLGYHGHMLTFPVQKGQTMNVVAFSSADRWDHRDEWVVHADRDKMYHDYTGWSPHVHRILHLMQNPDIWALFNHPPARTYHHDRVCLIGDAAHASTPHQGAGAGMAVEDAYVMSQALTQVSCAADFVPAFAAFDAVRRERTQKLVRTSRECGQLYDFELEGTRDDVDRVKENILTRLDWIWRKDIQEDVREVKRMFGGA